ncbi:hypothetical protein [Streptomyces niger]|uniref:hypothetical protein n=1 Tax=Streptomyces niger TaxID=66373 RepID=UPI00069A095C|nr:hypothetical protein [Streptomyces niger]
MSDESFRAEARGDGRVHQSGRDQYIIEDRRTFHVHRAPPGHASAPTSAEQLARGEELLASGEFAQAAAVLREALRAAESDAREQGLSLAGRQGPRAEQTDWDTARSAARRSERACAAAYGETHPYTEAARALRLRAERGA